MLLLLLGTDVVLDEVEMGEVAPHPEQAVQGVRVPLQAMPGSVLIPLTVTTGVPCVEAGEVDSELGVGGRVL